MPRSSPRRLTVDLHGYDVMSAIELARRRIEDAYRNGYEEIELLHGSGDVHEPVEEGRGRIKWELRRLHDAGAFDRWADRAHSWPKTTALVLRLRRNPSAQSESWRPAPGRRHG